MARQVLRWISPAGLARAGALVLGLAGVFFLLMAAVAVVVERTGATVGPAGIGISIGELAMFSLLPFAYAAFGWLLGYVVALVFNGVSRYTGGISIEISEEAEPSRPAARESVAPGADTSIAPSPY